MGVIRDQLQTLTGAEVLASQLSTAGGQVFVSRNAAATQADLADVVAFWRNVHAPTYGMPIPGSGKTSTGAASTPNIYTPETNETAYITGLSLINNNATDDATVTISIGNAVAWVGTVAAASAAPAIVVGAGQLSPFYLVAGLALDIAVTGALPGDVDYTLAYGLAVQG